MNSRQIEYSSDIDAIMIRIPKGQSEGKPVQAAQNAPLFGRQQLGKVLYAIHQDTVAKQCSASGA